MSKLPTDNLYKFVALSGVAVFITSIYLFVSKVFEYRDNLIAHKSELEFISPLTQIGAAVGFLLAVIGFYFWYVKLQKPSDDELSEKVKIAKAQAQRDKESLRLDKHHVIYEELSKFEHQTKFTNFLMLGEIAYGNKFEPSKIPICDRAKLKMHISFYAPELESIYEKIELLDSEFSQVLAEYLLNFESSQNKKTEFIFRGTNVTKEIALEIKKIQIDLAKIVNAETSNA